MGNSLDSIEEIGKELTNILNRKQTLAQKQVAIEKLNSLFLKKYKDLDSMLVMMIT